MQMTVQPLPSLHVLQTDNCPSFYGVALFSICPWLRPNNLQNRTSISSNTTTEHPIIHPRFTNQNKKRVLPSPHQKAILQSFFGKVTKLPFLLGKNSKMLLEN
jgi:hypothetical protein